MQRRTFIRNGLFWLAAHGVANSALLTSARPVFASTPDVVIAKGDAALATYKAVELLGGMSRFVKAGQKVVLKPNMSFAKTPESATNTHPEVVKAVVIMCKEAGAGSIRVLDHALQRPALCLERSGILDACNSIEEGICHHLVEERFYTTTRIEGARFMHENAFMQDALDADVIITLPVAKSHSGAGVSLSLKGQMGLIFDRHSLHTRYPLDDAIVDLNLLFKPALTIIDATRVLTSGGPSGPGHVITPNEIIASTDLVAADATAVASYPWYGRSIKPRQVRHIRLAAERGLGRMDIENLITQRVSV